jgi:hypothetical protein
MNGFEAVYYGTLPFRVARGLNFEGLDSGPTRS